MIAQLVQGSADDLDAVMQVMTAAFPDRFGEAWTRSQCAGILPLSGVQLILARDPGRKVCGFSLLRTVADEAELLLLAVSRAAQRQGIGATLLLNLPPGPALLALGLFAASYGAYVLIGARRLRTAPPWLAWPIGIVGGIFSSLFGTGGPVYIVYLSARIPDKSSLRATSAIIVAVSVWIRVGLFIATGLLLNSPLLALVAALLPVMVLGLWLGNRLHHALSGSGVLRLIAALLVGNGIALIIRAIGLIRA